MLNGTEHLDCCCGSPQHTLRFVLDFDTFGDDEIPTIYTDVQMAHYLPWYKRIWVAIKYIFGYDTVDHYGCWELDHTDADRMITMLTKLKDANTKYLAERNLKMHNPSETTQTTETDKNLYSGNDYEQTT